MKAAIILIVKNLAGMVITKTVVIWGLKLATKSTKNKIDDNVVSLVEGAYNNDTNQVMRSVERIVEEVKALQNDNEK